MPVPVLVDTLGTRETGAYSGGYVGSADITELAPNQTGRAKNSALALASQGVAYVQKRMGQRCMTTTPMSGSPAILGNYEYTINTSGTRYQLTMGDNGHLDKVTTSGTVFSNVSTAFTAGTHYPAFETAQGLCFIVNGVDAKKFNGTVVQTFGIVRPVVGSLSGSAGASGSPSGTYEMRVSYANSVTGAESSVSDTAASPVVLSSQKLSVANIPVSADSQVDTVYIYIRNTATQPQFYRAGSVTNGTTTATLDWVDANLTTVAPTTSSNNPPPAGLTDLAYHQGRLFGITATTLYWSNLFAPEAWNTATNFNGVNPSDGQNLIAIFSDHEVLMILKEDRLYVLTGGEDPAGWQINLVDADHGCMSQRTLCSANGYTYWLSRHGLTRWSGAGAADPIGADVYGDITDTVALDQLATSSAAYHEAQQRVLLALPGTGQTRATFLIPYNIQANAFEADSWDPMDCASLGVAHDSSGVPRVYMGNYAGQLFRLWDTNNDGVASGTVTGTFTASGASETVFTDSLATFDTTGGGLIERKITVLTTSGNIVGTLRPRITANTTTTFTVNVAVTGLTTGTAYTYVIGGPDFQWDTPWRTYALPWIKKRYEFLFILVKGTSFGSAAKIDIAFDYDNANANAKNRTLTITSASGTWDSAIWDRDVWDAPANIRQRFRVARTGFSWRARVRNSGANQPFAMLHLGMQAVTETTKQ